MFEEYTAVGLLLLVAIGLAGAMLVFSALTAQKARTNPAKDEAYECGLPAAMSQANVRFSVKFYLVAMLFILFDIEVVFLYPWAVVFKELVRENLAIFFSMLSFIGILFVGFLYAVRKDAFEWR